MNNTAFDDRETEQALGPRPAPTTAANPPLSDSRRAVRAALEGAPEPLTLAALSAVTGLHVNTLRGYLDALQAGGRVRRRRAVPSGRGRPAWLYEAVDGPAKPGQAEYAGLATALATAIHRTSADPRGDAIDAGRGWGRDLARGKGAPPERGAAGARRQVASLLADLGFAPETGSRASSVRLTRCPLLEAARTHPDVVCGVHLGIVQGALEAWGATSQEAELWPFSEPGACRLLLAGDQRGPDRVP